MMGPMDLFNAVTPESDSQHDSDSYHEYVTGHANYIHVTSQQFGEMGMKQSPLEKSILNEIGANGLLSYNDFCFLLIILSTPKRYLQTAFNILDINGDGRLEAKVVGI